jgi:hypothetical protein
MAIDDPRRIKLENEVKKDIDQQQRLEFAMKLL